MTPQERLIQVAAGEVGVKEVPAGSNRVKYNTWFYGREVSGASYPWCCAFVCWCFAQAGMAALVRKTGGCTTMMNWFKARGGLVPARQAQPGDLVFYQFDKDPYADHIGIVEKVTAAGVVAIEGNTSVTSQDNGGAVMRRTRKWGVIMAVGRPEWGKVEGSDDGHPHQSPPATASPCEGEASKEKEEVDMTKEEVKDLVAEEVKAALEPKRYHKVSELPWGRDAVERLRDAGIIGGDGEHEINLTERDLVTVAMVDKLRLAMLGEME